MIPKITQEMPNTTQCYWCTTCGASLTNPHTLTTKPAWKFCPYCGELIEYDLAKPVHWEPQNCEHCGCSLITEKATSTKPYFAASIDYVGAPLCRSCLQEHCVQTNCLQCEIGKQPDCPYSQLKKTALANKNDN